MWLNFCFGKCCVILSLVLVTGPVTRTVTHNVAELLFWKMLCHFVTRSCDGTSHQNSDNVAELLFLEMLSHSVTYTCGHCNSHNVPQHFHAVSLNFFFYIICF